MPLDAGIGHRHDPPRYMNLRDQLRQILPEILPADPAEPIKGTELIRLVKYRLRQEYSDATLRYHFSIMCCDPGSPIAKVEQGQGYYLRGITNQRGAATPASLTQARLGLLYDATPAEIDLAVARQMKFSAIAARDAESSGRFPFVFESSFAAGSPYENVWRCPDAAMVDWETGEVSESGMQISGPMLRMKQCLGVAPFSLTSVKLKLSVSHNSYREDFFQALSNARWGHAGELIIAEPVPDRQLVDELRELGQEFGLGIEIFGIRPDEIDDLPPGFMIPKMSSREFEAVQSRMRRQRLTSPRRRSLDWRRITGMKRDNDEFQRLFDWLEKCLADSRTLTWREFSGSASPV